MRNRAARAAPTSHNGKAGSSVRAGMPLKVFLATLKYFTPVRLVPPRRAASRFRPL